jgi:hypothetical protein
MNPHELARVEPSEVQEFRRAYLAGSKMDGSVQHPGIRCVFEVVSGLLIILAGCAAPIPDPTGRPSVGQSVSAPPSSSAPALAASPSAEPIDEPIDEPTPAPTPRPPAAYVSVIWANYGSHATVLVDKLNMRRFPGLDQDIYGRLIAGASIFIVDGPIAVDGLWWYEVESDQIGGRWVAGRAEEATPELADDTWFIRISPPRCSANVEMPLLARLSPWAVTHCTGDLHTVSGVIDDCELPHLYLSYVWEPTWVSSGCPFLLWDENEVRGSRYFSLAFPPGASLPELQRGDIVTLTGGFGFDTAKYGPCTVSGGGEISLETMTTVWQHACQHKFVVTGVTIRGHLELERRPW